MRDNFKCILYRILQIIRMMKILHKNFFSKLLKRKSRKKSRALHREVEFMGEKKFFFFYRAVIRFSNELISYLLRREKFAAPSRKYEAKMRKNGVGKGRREGEKEKPSRKNPHPRGRNKSANVLRFICAHFGGSIPLSCGDHTELIFCEINFN